MNDKEVGELWAQAKFLKTQTAHATSKLWADAAMNLIRKLVEERARWYGVHHPLQFTLRDFGIDPKEWEGK